MWRVEAGDRVIIPRGDSYLFPLRKRAFVQQSVLELAPPTWIFAMNPGSGAGSCAATFGAFGGAHPARYQVFRAVRAFDFALDSAPRTRPRSPRARELRRDRGGQRR